MAEVREHSGKNETDIKFMAIVKDIHLLRPCLIPPPKV